MRILHVEDDADTRDLVSLVLEAEGWEVVSVTTVREAMERAFRSAFDLYLIDNRIQGGSGNALCVGLRTVDPRTPILFYSGAVYPFDIKTAMACGAQGYLEKPCSPKVLVKEIRRLTERLAKHHGTSNVANPEF